MGDSNLTVAKCFCESIGGRGWNVLELNRSVVWVRKGTVQTAHARTKQKLSGRVQSESGNDILEGVINRQYGRVKIKGGNLLGSQPHIRPRVGPLSSL